MYGADVMRLSACLLTIVAWNEFPTCPWSGYDTSHLSCTKDTHFHAWILKIECNFKLCELHLCLGYSLSPFCAVLSTAPPHESWSPRKRREVSVSSSSLYHDVSNLCRHKWVLTSMKNSSAAQVSSCTWWSLQPDCTSAVPPVPADGVLEKESWLQTWQQCHHEVPSSTCSHWSFPGVKNFVNSSCNWILWVMQIPTRILKSGSYFLLSLTCPCLQARKLEVEDRQWGSILGALTGGAGGAALGNALGSAAGKNIWVICYCWGNSSILEGRFSKWF